MANEYRRASLCRRERMEKSNSAHFTPNLFSRALLVVVLLLLLLDLFEK
jgi:hypothetical protein